MLYLDEISVCVQPHLSRFKAVTWIGLDLSDAADGMQQPNASYRIMQILDLHLAGH